MAKSVAGFFVGVWFAVCLSLLWETVSGAQPRSPQWKSQTCIVNGCIADALNRLSAADAAAAKITTWHDVTYVWYRE